MTVTAKCLIESQALSDSPALYYTCPPNTRTIIDKLTVVNLDSSTVNFSMYILPSGVSVVANQYFVALVAPVTTKQTLDFTAIQNHILNPGDTIWALGDTASVLLLRSSGRECT